MLPTKKFGKGFDTSNLMYMRQFYLKFPKCDAVRHKLLAIEKCDAVSHESMENSYNLRQELSWTHYRLLLRVDNETAREWYMHEAADQHWLTRWYLHAARDWRRR